MRRWMLGGAGDHFDNSDTTAPGELPDRTCRVPLAGWIGLLIRDRPLRGACSREEKDLKGEARDWTGPTTVLAGGGVMARAGAEACYLCENDV